MSFMKKVASIAAPFASLIPGVGPLVGAGLGALGSLGGGSSKNKKGQPDPVTTQLLASIQQQQQLAKSLFDQGAPLTTQGTGYLNKSAGYYGDLLGGGQKQAQALAGPISDLRNSSFQNLQNVMNFSHRGNAAGAFADRGNVLGQQIARLRFDSQGQGASGLAGIGSTLLGSGTNMQTAAGGIGANATSALLGTRGQNISQQLSQDQLNAGKWSSMGEGIGSLLSVLLMPGGILNKSKKSSSPTIWGSPGGWGTYG